MFCFMIVCCKLLSSPSYSATVLWSAPAFGKPFKLNCHIMWQCSKLMRSTWHISIVNPAIVCARAINTPNMSSGERSWRNFAGQEIPQSFCPRRMAKVFLPKAKAQCEFSSVSVSVHHPVTARAAKCNWNDLYSSFLFQFQLQLQLPVSATVSVSVSVWDCDSDSGDRVEPSRIRPAAPHRMNISQSTVTPTECNSPPEWPA